MGPLQGHLKGSMAWGGLLYHSSLHRPFLKLGVLQGQHRLNCFSGGYVVLYPDTDHATQRAALSDVPGKSCTMKP